MVSYSSRWSGARVMRRRIVCFGGNSVDQISKAKWDGGKLVITTSSSFNGNTFETTMAFSLDAAGNLVVDSTSPGRGGGAPTTTKQTYKKS